MDPNPTKFPILSFVMSQIPHLQQPPPPSSQVPHLSDPEVLKSMTLAISEVTQTRSDLQTLGDRPSQEALLTAQAKIAAIDARVSKHFKEAVLSTTPGAVKQAEEEENSVYKDVIQLDWKYQAYEKLFSHYEDNLVKISGVFAAFDQEFVGVLQERVVELSWCALKFLPGPFWKLSGIIVLNLSKNRLEVIPDSIGGLEKLQQLYLSSNLLVSLPDSIGLLCNLKILDLSSNELMALPYSISHCRSLVELNASMNKLTDLPTNIGSGLVNLRSFSVHFNEISSFPTSICEMWSLRYLDVHFNRISSLPTSICEMRSLRCLDVHYNELCGLPDTIGGLTNLEILNLSRNFSDLKALPDTMGDLINLRELDLSTNQISVLPVTFGRLNNLTKLNLEQNPLVTPPMDIVNEGVEAVKEFMAKRWLDFLLEEEQKSQAQSWWLSCCTSWLINWFPKRVSGYLGAEENNQKDPWFDQQL